MVVTQTKNFGKQKKKLHANQVKILDEAVTEIVANVDIGDLKKGDLHDVRVYKFKISKQEYLLTYTETKKQITLLSVGAHENFYRDLKKTR